MEDTQSVSALIDSTSSKLQQLQKAFAELESHRAVTLNLKWKELEAHFNGLEKSLKRRFHELEDQEKVFRYRNMEAQETLEKREAAVVAKEHACLDKLQEKRDAAAFAISKAREKHRKVSPVEASATFSDLIDGTIAEEVKSPNSITSEEDSFMEIRSTAKDENLELKTSVNGKDEVRSYPQLVKFCEDMDSEGLHSFISDNRKNLAAVREEIPLALRVSPEPGSLVLDSLSSFYRGDLTSLDAKKDSGLLGLRRTCIMLMECLSAMLMSLDSVSVSEIISDEVKARARVIATEWKPKLGEVELDMSNGNSLEAHAFLQLLDTFCIASDFNAEELCRLVPLVSRRRQAADLCRSLGLADRMPGAIQVLVNSGRQIDAVNLAFAFELTEQFSPVALLKSYVQEAASKVIISPKLGNVSPGNGSPTSPNAQEVCVSHYFGSPVSSRARGLIEHNLLVFRDRGMIDVDERELSALKAVIKCVEEHKLEDQYPLDPLQKRVLQLEKMRAEKKRAAEVAKPQSKRPRASHVGTGPRATNYAVPQPERYPPQYMFERPYGYPPATYGPTAVHHNGYFGSGNGYQYHHHQVTYLH